MLLLLLLRLMMMLTFVVCVFGRAHGRENYDCTNQRARLRSAQLAPVHRVTSVLGMLPKISANYIAISAPDSRSRLRLLLQQSQLANTTSPNRAKRIINKFVSPLRGLRWCPREYVHKMSQPHTITTRICARAHAHTHTCRTYFQWVNNCRCVLHTKRARLCAEQTHTHKSRGSAGVHGFM